MILIELPRFEEVGVSDGFAEVGRSCFIGLNINVFDKVSIKPLSCIFLLIKIRSVI